MVVLNLVIILLRVSVLKLTTYPRALRRVTRGVYVNDIRISIRSALLRSLFCRGGFPGPIQPRLVVEYSDGMRILVESERDLALAAEFIRLKRRLEREGGAQ